MSTDYDHIAAVEKAIAEKYGSEAIENPRSKWDEKKEKRIPATNARIIF